MLPRSLHATGALGALSRFWLESVQDSVEFGRQVLSGTASPRELRKLRSRWLARLSHLADEQLRSPQFLELLTFTLHGLSAASPWRAPFARAPFSSAPFAAALFATASRRPLPFLRSRLHAQGVTR